MVGDKTTFNSVLESAVFSENDVQSLSQDSLHIASQRVNLTKQSFKQESFNEFISTASSKYISVDEQAKSSRRDLLSAKKVHKEGLKKRGYRLSSKILGQGAFGTAYKVYSLDVHHPRQELACKIMLLRKEKMSEKAYISSLHSFTNEVQVMQACSSHENVVSIREHFIDSHEDGLVHGYILMDFASLGSLHSKLMSSGPFEERVALDYFQQTASALEHLHLRGIAHRDLTLANILLASQSGREVVKLSDFGLSRKVYSKESGFILLSKPAGTVSFMAPELIECYILYKSGQKTAIRPYNCFGVDLWALGVCLYMMLCKVNPFLDSPQEDSVTGDHSFHSLLSGHLITSQSKYEDMQSLPMDGSSAGKEEQIQLAKEMFEKQIAGEWQVRQAVKQTTSAFTLQLLQKLLTYDPQERVNISQTLFLLRSGSSSV